MGRVSIIACTRPYTILVWSHRQDLRVRIVKDACILSGLVDVGCVVDCDEIVFPIGS